MPISETPQESWVPYENWDYYECILTKEEQLKVWSVMRGGFVTPEWYKVEADEYSHTQTKSYQVLLNYVKNILDYIPVTNALNSLITYDVDKWLLAISKTKLQWVSLKAKSAESLVDILWHPWWLTQFIKDLIKDG